MSQKLDNKSLLIGHDQGANLIHVDAHVVMHDPVTQTNDRIP
ncbi:MAG TPA: hypothetical protein VJ001_02255 [Rhodocyclaceae bacterium]|nr:hypothetical protein [Rhodocyclaceae bacterium]